MNFLRTVIGLVLLVATIGLTSCESWRVAVSDDKAAAIPVSETVLHG